jgi:hypothetical protein
VYDDDDNEDVWQEGETNNKAAPGQLSAKRSGMRLGSFRLATANGTANDMIGRDMRLLRPAPVEPRPESRPTSCPVASFRRPVSCRVLSFHYRLIQDSSARASSPRIRVSVVFSPPREMGGIFLVNSFCIPMKQEICKLLRMHPSIFTP